MLQPAARKVAGSSTARNKDLVAKILQYWWLWMRT
jgi:hypothetical protein